MTTREQSMDTTERKLLVLDLDETLVFATEVRLERPEDFLAAGHYVYKRPHLSEFIDAVLRLFKVGVWTSASADYAAQIAHNIFPQGSLEFVWSKKQCTPVLLKEVIHDSNGDLREPVKKLRKLKKKGYSLKSIIAVDDTPAKHALNYGNLVRVREFMGDTDDAELPLLLAYLEQLSHVANVRSIEKRNWRQQVSRGLLPPSVAAHVDVAPARAGDLLDSRNGNDTGDGEG